MRFRMTTSRSRSIGSWMAAVFLAAGLLTSVAHAVVLDDENRIDVVLGEGTTVRLYGEAGSSSGQKTNRYYYLPVNLRLSTRADGTPEFLFLKFTTEKRETAGGVSGAIMHFLMEWGLTPEQEQELREKLQKEHSNAELVGAAQLLPQDESGSFQIVSATMSDQGDKGLTRSLVTSGKAPLVPGGKAAAASRLSAEGAQLLAASFEKSRSITDVSIALNFSYATLAPAARGSVVFDWSRYEEQHDKLEAQYKSWVSGSSFKAAGLGIIGVWSFSPTRSHSYDEMRSHYDFLIEKQIVRLEFDELIPDERVAKIRDAFFQFFLNSFGEASKDEAPPPPGEKEKEQVPNIRVGNQYKYSKTFVSRSFKQKVQRFDLSYRMAIRWPFQIVGNLASWYDAVRDNPKCVAAVNLNDPFFQHRDIHFIVDLDAKEMFDDAVNYVTVNVRKKRSSGNDFQDAVTFDAEHLKTKGVTAVLTYARGDDTNTDVYEYQAQWSLRGGNLFPVDPPWQSGSWEGVTLAPPVVPRTIEVEGDLEEMKASGITRVTAQIHYPKFGEEVETNIALSPAKGEALVSKTIFTDRAAKGYAYRLVVDHKTEGKLALPWSAQVGDDYIYATIPEDLFTEAEVKDVAKAAAANLMASAKEKVLDKFKELVGGSR